MKRIETSIQDCYIIQPDVHEDHRGNFFESYHREKFAALGIVDEFVQDNHSFSRAGVLRGMHFQFPPMEMSKLVRCTRGTLFDVAVDMRRTSPSFKKWFGIELSQMNRKMLYLPKGCAHGFYALSDCELFYKCSELFYSDYDGGWAWNDPDIGIQWPFTQEPILSARDKQQPKFEEIIDRVNAL